jgi:hypothetical protein
MVSRFFKRVARHFANEVAVVTPNAKVLSHAPDEGLKKWKQLPRAERQTLQDFGKYNARLDPAPPAGGLIARVYARGLVRDSVGRLQIYKTEVARSWEAGRDRLWLTEKEWKSLLPAAAKKSAKLTVAQPIVERICRRCLIDLVRVGGNGGPRRPEEVLGAKIQITVEEVAPQTVRLRLDGSARLATHDTGSGARGKEGKIDPFLLQGFLTYDVPKKRLTRFDVVAFSETGHYDEIHRKALPLAFAFELAEDNSPSDRLPPSSFGKDYFGTGRTQ